MSSEESTGQPTAAAFSDALADLKRKGSLLLLAGVAHETMDGACERLLGAPGADDRRKLVVSTSAAHDRDLDADRDRVIRYRTDARSAAATESSGGAGPALDRGPSIGSVPETVVDGELTDLIAAIDAELDVMEAEAGEFDPAELRICVDSADALIAAHSQKTTFNFFHALSGMLRTRRAMGHVHLPATFDDEAVQIVSPLFDAVIEVESGGRQRWHLREPELTTEWLQL